MQLLSSVLYFSEVKLPVSQCFLNLSRITREVFCNQLRLSSVMIANTLHGSLLYSRTNKRILWSKVLLGDADSHSTGQELPMSYRDRTFINVFNITDHITVNPVHSQFIYWKFILMLSSRTGVSHQGDLSPSSVHTQVT
jgi:hypothetical protein